MSTTKTWNMLLIILSHIPLSVALAFQKSQILTKTD